MGSHFGEAANDTMVLKTLPHTFLLDSQDLWEVGRLPSVQHL